MRYAKTSGRWAGRGRVAPVQEDLRRAQEGLMELRSGDEVWYKHIDQLTRDDRPARTELENARAAWIRERLSRQPRPQ